MRENCQSGSMSGNRKQDQAKPDSGDAAKAQSTNHRETTATAPVLDSTPLTHLPFGRVAYGGGPSVTSMLPFLVAQ